MRIFAHARTLILAGSLAALLPHGTRAAQDLVERGRYLADAAHCVACHTREDGAAYALQNQPTW